MVIGTQIIQTKALVQLANTYTNTHAHPEKEKPHQIFKKQWERQYGGPYENTTCGHFLMK